MLEWKRASAFWPVSQLRLLEANSGAGHSAPERASGVLNRTPYLLRNVHRTGPVGRSSPQMGFTYVQTCLTATVGVFFKGDQTRWVELRELDWTAGIPGTIREDELYQQPHPSTWECLCPLGIKGRIVTSEQRHTLFRREC